MEKDWELKPRVMRGDGGGRPNYGPVLPASNDSLKVERFAQVPTKNDPTKLASQETSWKPESPPTGILFLIFLSFISHFFSSPSSPRPSPFHINLALSILSNAPSTCLTCTSHAFPFPPMLWLFSKEAP